MALVSSLFSDSVFVKAVEKRRVPHADLSINAQAEIVPAANPVAVMQGCGRCFAVMNKGFVITAAGADGPRPAGVAVVARADMMRIEKIVARFVVHATLVHVP